MWCYFLLCKLWLSRVYTCPLRLKPPSYPPSQPSKSSQSLEPHSLCLTAASWCYLIHRGIYIYQCWSLNWSHPPLPPLCPQVRSVGPHLCSCPANRLGTWFLKSNGSKEHRVRNSAPFLISGPSILQFWFLLIKTLSRENFCLTSMSVCVFVYPYAHPFYSHDSLA